MKMPKKAWIERERIRKIQGLTKSQMKELERRLLIYELGLRASETTRGSR